MLISSPYWWQVGGQDFQLFNIVLIKILYVDFVIISEQVELIKKFNNISFLLFSYNFKILVFKALMKGIYKILKALRVVFEVLKTKI